MPGEQVSQAGPRHSRASIFSLTTKSSSSSSHPSPDHTPEHSPERILDSSFSSKSPSSARFLSPSEPQSPRDLLQTSAGMSSDESRPNGRTSPPPSKSRSVLNLTSSTLFGIYDADRDEPETPWGSGAQTPALRSGGGRGSSFDAHKSLADGLREKTLQQLRDPSSFAANRDYQYIRSASGADAQPPAKRRRKVPSWTRYIFGVAWRVAALFLLGMAYGGVVTHLHDSRHIAPVEVQINRGSWTYLCSWGALAAVLGFLLPWVDEHWRWDMLQEHAPPLQEEQTSEKAPARVDVDRRMSEDSTSEHSGAEWNPVVRSVGAFVGIAFAIRRLPWQSTLQVSLTLALVNPVIWYLLDRTRTGVALSFLTGITGATAMMGINPDIVPSPAATAAAAASYQNTFGGGGGVASPPADVLLGVSLESIGVATWIGSVFFCSCVCFGNVGRRLAKGVL